MTPAQIAATFTAVDRIGLHKRFRDHPITDLLLIAIGVAATAELRERWDDVHDAWHHNRLGWPPDAGSVSVEARHEGDGHISLGLRIDEMESVSFRRTLKAEADEVT